MQISSPLSQCGRLRCPTMRLGHPVLDTPCNGICGPVTGAVPVIASVANRAAYTAANCFSIKEYHTCAPFHSWDQKPKGSCSHSDHCLKPHPKPSCVTCTSSSQGPAASRACKAWTCLMMHFTPCSACSEGEVQSQFALFFQQRIQGTNDLSQMRHKFFPIP